MGDLRHLADRERRLVSYEQAVADAVAALSEFERSLKRAHAALDRVDSVRREPLPPPHDSPERETPMPQDRGAVPPLPRDQGPGCSSE